MPPDTSNLQHALREQLLAHIESGADPDDLASGLLEHAGALLISQFGAERTAALLRTCADELEARADG